MQKMAVRRSRYRWQKDDADGKDWQNSDGNLDKLSNCLTVKPAGTRHSSFFGRSLSIDEMGYFQFPFPQTWAAFNFLVFSSHGIHCDAYVQRCITWPRRTTDGGDTTLDLCPNSVFCDRETVAKLVTCEANASELWKCCWAPDYTCDSSASVHTQAVVEYMRQNMKMEFVHVIVTSDELPPRPKIVKTTKID